MTRTHARMDVDWSLYLVTDARLCAATGVPDTVAAALRGGVSAVQLRDSHCDDREFTTLARALVTQLAGTGVPLIVNDRAHLVAGIGADGVHIGQDDLAISDARALIGPDVLLGLSVQTLLHVNAVRDRGHQVDYLGVGPVWGQVTKPDAAPPCGPDSLARIVATSPWPCVAIGGIGAAQAPLVRAAGAAGVAVVSAICGRPDPEAAARELRRAWDAGA